MNYLTLILKCAASVWLFYFFRARRTDGKSDQKVEQRMYSPHTYKKQSGLAPPVQHTSISWGNGVDNVFFSLPGWKCLCFQVKSPPRCTPRYLNLKATSTAVSANVLGCAFFAWNPQPSPWSISLCFRGGYLWPRAPDVLPVFPSLLVICTITTVVHKLHSMWSI